jgi:hypothetical protein
MSFSLSLAQVFEFVFFYCSVNSQIEFLHFFVLYLLSLQMHFILRVEQPDKTILSCLKREDS